MPTIEQQLNELVKQKNALATALRDKGVEAGDNETLNSLVPKVGEIKSGSGLNIHYGDTAPEDTSMLWVKCNEADSVTIESELSKTKTSTKLSATLTKGLTDIGAGVVGTDIYLFGGLFKTTATGNRVNTIYKFDTLTETLTTLSTTLPNIASCIGVGVVETDIYLFGGRNYNTQFNTIYKFDTLTETLTTLSATLPNVENGLGVGVVGTDIYVFSTRDIYKFDTLTETLTALSVTMPEDFGGLPKSVGVINNAFYIFGGHYYSAYNDAIYKFYSETKEIFELSPKTAKGASMAVGVIGTDIYVLGGGNDGTGGCNTIAIFKDMKLDNNKLLIHSNSDTNIVDILGGDNYMEVGITQVYQGNQHNLGDHKQAYRYKNKAWTQI